MKSRFKNSIIFLFALILSFLFYEEEPGLNMLLSLPILFYLFHLKNDNFLKKGNYFTEKLIFIISSAALIIHGSEMAFRIYFFSIFLFLPTLAGYYSYILTPFSLAGGGLNFFNKILFNRNEESAQNDSTSPLIKRIIVVGATLFISIFFIIIYSNSSTQFSNLISGFFVEFRFQYILVYALFLLLLTYIYFYKNHFLVDQLQAFLSISRPISKQSYRVLLFKPIVIILSIMLGVLLLSELFSMNLNQSGALKRASFYSDAVHGSVEISILSVIMVGLLFSFFFSNQEIRKLLNPFWLNISKFWLSLNMLFLLRTAKINSDYVFNYGLTEKRLGVYIFIILCLISLIILWVSLIKSYNFLAMTDKILKSALLYLSIISLLPQSLFITQFNNELMKKGVNVDIYHMLNKDYDNILGFEKLLIDQKKYSNSYYFIENENRKFYFRTNYEKLGLGSFNVLDYIIYKEITK